MSPTLARARKGCDQRRFGDYSPFPVLLHYVMMVHGLLWDSARGDNEVSRRFTTYMWPISQEFQKQSCNDVSCLHFPPLALSNTYSRSRYPRFEAEEEKTKNVWLKGCTDMGSITVLYSQPISALQILGQDGKWGWIKHFENAPVINTGDVMEFLSGGNYKAAIHRSACAESYNHPQTSEIAFV
ncbi:Clavaminate synthase-like protein [Mycena sanguinolenta]|uniref:Clavaminate synthase-like protein n=1 Tax=Mycena sanguinolenta TaxID=230812 RepID=A0A8H6YZ08_9AGAR|nr:Clavaminate synthase-like protein [Mycena sanguinolenta]